jgi:hypothetical protein
MLSKEKAKYFLFALGIKILMYCFLYLGLVKENNPYLVGLNYAYKDFGSYIGPPANLVNDGTYYEYNEKGKLYAYKTPGTLPLYGPMYYFFGEYKAQNLLILTQILLEGIAAYLLIIIADFLFKNKRINWMVLILNGISAYVSYYTIQTTSECLTTSFLIFTIYFLIRFYQNYSLKDLFWCGFFAAWAYFMRPVSILIFLPIIIVVYSTVKRRGFNFVNFIKACLIVSVTFMVSETAWIYRNYKLLGEFVPVDQSQKQFGSPSMQAMFKLITSWGGNNQAWIEKGEAHWFFQYPYNETVTQNEMIFHCFPKHVLETIPADSLNEIKSNFLVINGKKLDSISTPISNKIISKCNYFTAKYKSEHLFRYHFSSRLRVLALFLFPKQTFNLTYHQPDMLSKLIRLFFLVHYYFILLIFIIGLVFLRPNFISRNLLLFILSVIILYSVVMRLSENRYLVTVFPIITMFSCYTINQLLIKIKKVE